MHTSINWYRDTTRQGGSHWCGVPQDQWTVSDWENGLRESVVTRVGVAVAPCGGYQVTRPRKPEVHLVEPNEAFQLTQSSVPSESRSHRALSNRETVDVPMFGIP